MAFFFKVTFPAFLISISRCNKFILFRRKAFLIFNCIVFNFDRYWKYYGFILEEGPREITRFGLPSSLTDPDAAFVWGGNGKTYFFKGNNYWRYNEFKKIPDDNYPRPISVWGRYLYFENWLVCHFKCVLHEVNCAWLLVQIECLHASATLLW